MSEVYSTHPLAELLARWGRGELTVEQLAGHLLQHMISQDQRLTRLEKPAGRPQASPPSTTHPA